jgi:hypothetical protein
MKRNMYPHPRLMMLVLALAVASVTTPASAITYLGDVGTVSSNAAGTTLPIPVGAGGVAAGNTIVVGFASRGASTYNVPVVTDTAGNTYTPGDQCRHLSDMGVRTFISPTSRMPW